ncbi:hypothetical protein HanIR_Chr04g0193531 [Helianthus annuus]|nr:hypothetical protein HanIR_Chr04g0193531 [Helianthus annuus]
MNHSSTQRALACKSVKVYQIFHQPTSTNLVHDKFCLTLLPLFYLLLLSATC